MLAIFKKRGVEILGFAKTVSKKHGDGYVEDFRGSLMRKSSAQIE
jgi:hypothetical protein